MKRYWLLPGLLCMLSCNTTADKKVTIEEKEDSVVLHTTTAGPDPSSLAATDLPAEFRYKGKVQDAWKWTDSLGENIFFTTVVAPYNDNDKGEHGEDGQNAELYAFHYVKKDGNYQLAWEMKDGEISCPLDIVTEFIRGAATVTDLDKDGIAETKVQYALACRGDVSPSSMKLILQENKAVYILQGSRWVEVGPESKFDINASNVNLEKLPPGKEGEDNFLRSFGRYESEKSFAGAPPEFLIYARNEWLKYVIENLK